ncbi:ATP-binding protein [Rhizobium sp. NPDC090275]|uniref:ATP-binding protein n=1 Tax=Rhizobium sp. NPDC090275 TaxID=3364498 RepID=UPI00383BD5AD
MIRAAHASGDIIRKTGKSAATLQLFAVALLVVLAWLFWEISNRYTALHDGVRENALWSVYQLDRETRKFVEELDRVTLGSDYGDASLKALSMRFDILYSRMTTLDQGRFEQYFVSDSKIVSYLQPLRAAILEDATLFDEIASGAHVPPERLRALRAKVSTMAANAEQLLTYTNNALSSVRADDRDEILPLERESMALIAMLILCVAFLIFTLRRQLSNVRAAGLSLETMAEKINAALQGAEAGNRAKSQFMATMGHEIRTPLNAILGMVELLELARLPEAAVAQVKAIRRSGHALLDIINEILDFSKIEHGRLELEYRTVELAALFRNTLEIMKGRAAESGNALALDMPPSLSDRWVRTDPTRLRQVVLNLLSNALKFTTKGNVTLRIREMDTGQKLRIEVCDNGIGIDQSGIEKLFQPFTQVDASITRKYGGTGLGLTICREIVSKLGGSISVESVVGRGSTFWFEVPFEAVEPETPATACLVEPLRILPCMRVLVVEDNAMNQQVILKFLDHLGQDTTLAENGEIAVAKASSAEFDLILMDMQMPVMDGIEATRQIRAKGGYGIAVPIVAMTANASEEDRRLCLEAGMTDFRIKPISLSQLHEVLSAAAGRSVRRMVTSVSEERRAELVAILGEDAFSALLGSFFADATQLIKDAREALAAHDKVALDRTLHSLKGAAANLGLPSVAARSQDLREGHATGETISTLGQMIDDARQEFAA